MFIPSLCRQVNDDFPRIALTLPEATDSIAGGSEWGLVSLAAFKAVAAPSRTAGWVRFPHASANGGLDGPPLRVGAIAR